MALLDESLLFGAVSPGFKDKAKYMLAGKCCLLQMGADGIPREVMLDLDGSWPNNKHDYFLNYVGRYMTTAP